MTVIVGLVDNNKIYMGGDSAGVAGHSLAIRADKKIFIKDNFIFGFTTSFRMGQILQYSFIPPQRDDKDLFSYMATDFVDAVRDCFAQKGFKKNDNGVDEGGTFLVGTEGRLFAVESDFQIAENIKPYDAVGSGANISLGALYALSDAPFSTKTKLLTALEAAEDNNSVVRAPFTILSL